MRRSVPFAVLQEAVRVLRCEAGPANSMVAGAAASYLLVNAYSAPLATDRHLVLPPRVVVLLVFYQVLLSYHCSLAV